MVDASALKQISLKAVDDSRDRSAPNYDLAKRGEVSRAKEDERRDYFFSTGLDRWLEGLQDVTFPTSFLSITPDEAREIVAHWKRYFRDRTSDSPDIDDSMTTVPHCLKDLCARIDQEIASLGSSELGVFIKLSTRSPKDSEVAFAKARASYTEEVRRLEQPPSANDKLILLGKMAIESLRVVSGEEGVRLLISSTRVGEDLEYALSTGDDNFQKQVSLVVRKWVEIPLWAEFRGFVWNKKLTSIGQYNHPVKFEELSSKQERIQSDLEAFFATVCDKIPLDRYIIDFAWTEDKVYLVEVNPFDGEIVFPASTGLWSWEDDKEQMMAGPLELRIRQTLEDPSIMKKNIDPLWRAVLFS